MKLGKCYKDLFKNSLGVAFYITHYEPLRMSYWNSLGNLLWNSLGDSLGNLFLSLLRESYGNSFRSSK